MKRIRYCLFVLFLTVLFPVRAASPAGKGLLLAADSLYLDGNYSAAAGYYEQLLKLYPSDPDVYYNLGNCHYRLAQPVQALWRYEQAALLDPADRDIRDNIAFLSTEILKVSQTASSNFFFVLWWDYLCRSLTLSGWIACGIATFLFLLLGILAYFFAPRLQVRKIGFGVACICLLVCIASARFAYLQNEALVERTTALVRNESGIELRNVPTSTGTSVGKIPMGQKVRILDRTIRGWMQVELPDRKIGWAQTSDLLVI